MFRKQSRPHPSVNFELFERAKREVKAGGGVEFTLRLLRFEPTHAQLVVLTGIARDVEQAGVWR